MDPVKLPLKTRKTTGTNPVAAQAEIWAGSFFFLSFFLNEFTELNQSVYLGFAYWEHAHAGVPWRDLSQHTEL